MSTTTKTEMNADLRAMADTIKAKMSISPEGINKEEGKSGETYAEQLMQHRNKTIADKVEDQKFDALYAAATHVANGEMAADFFSTNKDVHMVTSKQHLGKDNLLVRTHRSKTYPIPNSDKSVTNYCQTAIIWDKYAGGGIARQAKEHVQAYARGLLAE